MIHLYYPDAYSLTNALQSWFLALKAMSRQRPRQVFEVQFWKLPRLYVIYDTKTDSVRFRVAETPEPGDDMWYPVLWKLNLTQAVDPSLLQSALTQVQGMIVTHYPELLKGEEANVL